MPCAGDSSVRIGPPNGGPIATDNHIFLDDAVLRVNIFSIHSQNRVCNVNVCDNELTTYFLQFTSSVLLREVVDVQDVAFVQLCSKVGGKGILQLFWIMAMKYC